MCFFTYAHVLYFINPTQDIYFNFRATSKLYATLRTVLRIDDVGRELLENIQVETASAEMRPPVLTGSLRIICTENRSDVSPVILHCIYVFFASFQFVDDKKSTETGNRVINVLGLE